MVRSTSPVSRVRLKNPYRFVVVPIKFLLSYTAAPMSFSPDELSSMYPEMVAFCPKEYRQQETSSIEKTLFTIRAKYMQTAGERICPNMLILLFSLLIGRAMVPFVLLVFQACQNIKDTLH